MRRNWDTIRRILRGIPRPRRCDPAMVQTAHAIDTIRMLLGLKRIKSGQSAVSV